ncbi:MAG: hypothetical protein ACK5A0_15840 [Polaromonas sp.]|jgi:hypothetical protein
MSKIITVPVTISEEEAWALAQFVKRVGWSEMRQNAQDDEEAYLIRSGIVAVQAAFAAAGFSPR